MTCTEKKKARSPHQAVGRWIRVEKRLAIYLRDRFKCSYCGIDLHGAAPSEIHLDHLVCQSDGKKDNSESNLATACKTCNYSRQDKPVTEFASKAALKRIAKQTAKPLAPFIVTAKALIAGRTGGADS